MPDYTRGEFLGMGAALGVAMGVGRWPSQADVYGPFGGSRRVGGAGPDLVLLDGRVYTVDDANPRAEAFAVKHGRFVAVGSTDDVRNLVTPDTEVIDAGGMTVTPGFIDAHTHPASGGIRAILQVDLDLRSIEDIKDAIRREAERTPEGEWIVGYKYDDLKAGDRRITRWDLDEAAPNHPVQVSPRGGHASFYNSMALELAGIDESVEDPAGGRFFRDEDGRLNGMVAAAAREPFREFLPDLSGTREERREGVKVMSEEMTAAGLTTVHDAGAGIDDLIAYQDAYHAGEMRFRVYSMFRAPYDHLKEAGVRSGFGDEWLRLGGVKYSADGAAQTRTMAMSEPYIGQPDYYGILYMTQEEIHEAVEDAYAHDFRIGIHANGDVTIDRVLNAYERVLEKYPREDNRPRIEHCSLVNPDLLQRIADVGAVPNPFGTYLYYHGDKWHEYGEERMRWMFAHRSFLDYGIPVTFTSDYVPGPYDPLMGIQSMVTRRDWQGTVWGPNQRVSVEEALRISTINGAYASFEEDVKGSITPGKLADFVLMDDDPHEVPEDEILDISVVRTVVGGQTVHSLM